MAQYDITKTPKAAFLEQFRLQNPRFTLTDNQVSIVGVMATTGDEDYNTSATMSGEPSQGATGQQAVRLNRILLTQGIATPPTFVTVAAGATEAVAKTAVCSAFRIRADQLTASAYEAPAVGGVNGTITLAPTSATNLAYLPTPLTVQLRAPNESVPDLVDEPDLDGFDPA